MERLSGLDASFLYLETPSLHMHVGLCLVFDPSTVPGGYSFDRMKRSIEARLPAAPVFQRRLMEVPFRLGHPVWVEDADFDIDYHVRLAAVPHPGGLRQLADLAGDITGRQLDRSRPLWEMWIVEGLADGRIGFVAKMHHSTVDGVSGAALLSVLFDLSPEPAVESLPPDQEVDERVPSGIELMTQALVARTLRPIEMTRDLVRTGQRVLDVRRVRQEPHNRSPQAKAALPLSAPRTSFNGALTWRRSVALTAIGLEDVKRLKNATGTTVTDGALRGFLLEGDELPPKPLVAVVPVSVRSDVDDPRGSNQLSTMFVQLPVELDDPLERLTAIHDGTLGAKEEHEALGPDTLITWAEHGTPNFFANAARFYSRMRLADRHRPIANLVISNVPGPDFPLYLAGAELESGFPLGPVMEGMGVNITIMSYQGILNWGIHASPDTIPRLWSLTAAVPLALDELLLAAGEDPAVYRSEAAATAARASGVAVGLGEDHPVADAGGAGAPESLS
jgi:diacylglycerol O-acyltransferase